MLALSMGGVNYPWLSTPILALFAAALVLGIAFIVRLRTAPEPLIPLSILSNREARLAIAANAFGWGPIVGLHIFLPMYLQNIVGMAPAHRGIERADARGRRSTSAPASPERSCRGASATRPSRSSA